jgi:hypothetical protein
MCRHFYALILVFVVSTSQCSAVIINKKVGAMPKKNGPVVGGRQAPAPKAKVGTSAELSRETEEFIMSVLRGRQEGPIRERAVSEAKPAINIKQLGKIWDELLEIGFSKEDAELGIRESSSESLASVLDWLCLNLPEERSVCLNCILFYWDSQAIYCV